jgi:hypothetical protein
MSRRGDEPTEIDDIGSELPVQRRPELRRPRQGISTMKTARGVVTVVSLDDRSGRLAIQVDGIVTYVGSPEECQRRLKILKRDSPDPSERDRALGRAVRHS